MKNKAPQHIHLDEMVAYLEGTLAPAGREKMESALLQDPDLQDDLEALRLAFGKKDGKDQLNTHATQVASSIQKLSPAKRFSFKPIHWGLAAAMIILVSLGVWSLLPRQAELSPESMMAWNEVPTVRGAQTNQDQDLRLAFRYGLDNQWEASADIFHRHAGSYFQQKPVRMYEARALSLTGDSEAAIEIFSDELNNPELLPETMHEIRMYRLFAYISANQCQAAQADWAVLSQVDSPLLAEKSEQIKKILNQKCK